MMVSLFQFARLLWLFFACSITCHAFEFGSLPKFNNPFDSIISGNNSPGSTALNPGDTVAVVGASGNVGKLVALRLSDTYKVHGITRNPSSVSPFFEGRENSNQQQQQEVKLFQCDLLKETEETSASACPMSLVPALQNANALVICTGTTAFPTKAWSRSGDATVTGDVLKALVDTKFSIKDAIASLDELGLNTPTNVDDRANAFLLNAWNSVCKVRQKRVIMLSSIGVQRRDAMPFPILNACGVLDAKAAGEESIQKAAATGGYSYTIIRPGQLFGGPYDNNYYLGTLFQLDKDADTQDVEVGRGDELLGDTLRSTLAEVTAQICEGDYARDMDFACVNVKGESPSVETVQEKLKVL
uniref:NAD(P)-binding domain-containing protein n=1 Tax=Grammatophora oceanica TaxID=210454 RepID=A0A7S1UXL2_9STRA|mmetsp:Transcript_28398/g.41853  ORF Transcript_28398/g.41853 Transcript_28398/m.41853 type:complete len:358 (+) Transcript_28398:132-1205(+)|eukprot:CAMPEP_0194031610 /NCGR_PEP_ID=MMETSP0009_2-20130614/4745_1 /TAXON_ID=210454 /ORGANISM="Grammatophora oceanica, Strain CCMP 410" /LENGTH=357 /DNA_ID=CAMNT_0038671817 /DNA_START=129 /DNA_END=1202 /DNA_ORIENTATION=+